MRRRARSGIGLAATIVAAALLCTATASAAPARDRLAIKVVSRDQGAVIDGRKLVLFVRSSSSGTLRLRSSLRGSRPLRRLTKPRNVRIRSGRRRVTLRLTAAGRTRLGELSGRCVAASAKVVGVRRGARFARSRKAVRRRALLAPDRARCAPATGGGSGGGGGGDDATGGEGAGAPVSSNLRAGAASADITAPVGTPMFAYTARSAIANPDSLLQLLSDPDENLYAKSFEPSRGIHTRVRARAIVLEQEGRKFALVQTDLGGLPFALVQDVLRRVAGTGIDGERLLLSATHTHSSTGPIWPLDSLGYQLLGGDLFDPRVFEITAEGISEAILAANEKLEPALIGAGTAELRGASNNRNFEPFRRNPETPADEQEARNASINPRMTVIRVDALDGSPLGVWSNFAVHPTSFGDSNLLFSGDHAATTERLVEREIAAEAAAGGAVPHAPVVNVWTNSAEGDVSPDGSSPTDAGDPLYYVPSSAAGANMAGIKVAGGVLDAWRDAGARMTGEPEIDARRTFMIFDGTAADGDVVGPIEALGAGGIVADDGTCSPLPLIPGHGLKLPAAAGIGLVPSTASVSLWRLGSLGIASFPSEITTQMGRRITGAIANESGGALDDTVIAGLTNGYNSYTATPEEYDACHYEGSFTLFGRQQGARYRDIASGLVDPLLAGMPVNPGLEPPQSGVGLPQTPPLLPTPDAGAPVSQPAPVVRRYQRIAFVWKGGDPGVDAPRGRPFVSLQRLDGGDWTTIATEDGPEDTTAHDGDGNWTEIWQFAGCEQLGSYRFHVSGRASRSLLGAAEDYELDSSPFELLPTDPLEIVDAAVVGDEARVRARYPDPGASLLALPRRVRDGFAALTIREPDGSLRQLTAEPEDSGLAFIAQVPPGSTIESARVEDACGNSTA